MGFPIAVVTDPIQHSGSNTGTITGSGQSFGPVTANSLSVAVNGATVVCSTHPAVSPNVVVATGLTLINGINVALNGNLTTCGAVIVITPADALIRPTSN